MEEKKTRSIFQSGPITPETIAKVIANHQSKLNIGAHDIFLGQVRADSIEGKVVKSIEYSTYEEMSNAVMHQIREDIFSKYEITCMHVLHSTGIVLAGELSLMVFTSSKHRKVAFEACIELVDRIKNEVPVWGKEIFEEEGHQWKTNR